MLLSEIQYLISGAHIKAWIFIHFLNVFSLVPLRVWVSVGCKRGVPRYRPSSHSIDFCSCILTRILLLALKYHLGPFYATALLKAILCWLKFIHISPGRCETSLACHTVREELTRYVFPYRMARESSARHEATLTYVLMLRMCFWFSQLSNLIFAGLTNVPVAQVLYQKESGVDSRLDCEGDCRQTVWEGMWLATCHIHVIFMSTSLVCLC